MSSRGLSAVALAKADASQDRDANIHARARTARQPQGKAEAIAVNDAGRHGHRQSLRVQLLALPVTRLARLAPHFATAAAT